MNDEYKSNLCSTVLDIYPIYLKKDFLKQLVENDLIINNKKIAIKYH